MDSENNYSSKNRETSPLGVGAENREGCASEAPNTGPFGTAGATPQMPA